MKPDASKYTTYSISELKMLLSVSVLLMACSFRGLKKKTQNDNILYINESSVDLCFTLSFQFKCD